MKQKKCRISSRFASFVFYAFGIAGFSCLISGIVFFILALKYKDCSRCSPTFTDISIILITLGIGVITISFASREKASKENDYAAEIRQNTSEALNIYHSVISINEYIFIREILVKLYEKEEDAIVKLKDSYLDEIDEDSFSSNLEKYSSRIIKSANEIICQNSDFENGFNRFENNLHKYLLKFEEIAWRFNQQLIIEEVFYSSMYFDLKEFFLLSLAFIYSNAYENELMNLSLIPLLKRE